MLGEKMDFESSAEVLKKISSGYKLKIIQLLIKNDFSVSQMQEKLGIEQSLLSHHLKELRRIGFLESYKKGRNQFYQISTNYREENQSVIQLGCCQLSF